MGYLFMKKKFKTRICIIIPTATPYDTRLTHVGVEGDTVHGSSAVVGKNGQSMTTFLID